MSIQGVKAAFAALALSGSMACTSIDVPVSLALEDPSEIVIALVVLGTPTGIVTGTTLVGGADMTISLSLLNLFAPGGILAMVTIDDVRRVAAVRDTMGPEARIRVDANGAWDVEQARDALGALAAYGIEYAEQPCATVPELKRLRVALARGGIDVPVAADESIRKAEDPLLVAREEAADLVVVKVAPLGGVRRALEVVQE